MKNLITIFLITISITITPAHFLKKLEEGNFLYTIKTGEGPFTLIEYLLHKQERNSQNKPTKVIEKIQGGGEKKEEATNDEVVNETGKSKLSADNLKIDCNLTQNITNESMLGRIIVEQEFATDLKNHGIRYAAKRALEICPNDESCPADSPAAIYLVCVGLVSCHLLLSR